MTTQRKDEIQDALEIFANAVDGDGWVYHPDKSPIHSNGFPIMTPEQFRKIYNCLKSRTLISPPVPDDVAEAVGYIEKFLSDPAHITTSFMRHQRTLIRAASTLSALRDELEAVKINAEQLRCLLKLRNEEIKQLKDSTPPVDTIAVPREVLEVVREGVSHAVVYLKSCGHELQSEEDKRVNFKDPDHAMYICLSEALASLDAVLEGE